MDEKTNGAEQPQQPEFFPLDEAALSILADIDSQINALNQQWSGAFVLFLRQHKLQGNWRLAQNRKEIVRDPAAPATVPAVQP